LAPRNKPPHWHGRFHTFNRPQLSFRLKYFIRLVRIGIAYCAEAWSKKQISEKNAEYEETIRKSGCHWKKNGMRLRAASLMQKWKQTAIFTLRFKILTARTPELSAPKFPLPKMV
jgi:hypothetical protein